MMRPGLVYLIPYKMPYFSLFLINLQYFFENTEVFPYSIVHNFPSKFAAVSLWRRTSSGHDDNRRVVPLDYVQDITSVPIAPDSFDESHLDVLGSGHIISPSKEAYPADLPDKSIAKEQVVIENASLSVPALDTVEIIKPSAHDASTILEENNLDGCVKKSMLIPQSTSPTNRIITKESEELCAKGDLVQTEHHLENKEAKSTSCSTEGSKLNLVNITITQSFSLLYLSTV